MRFLKKKLLQKKYKQSFKKKVYKKLPKGTKKWIEKAAIHAKRRGDEVPNNLYEFFES